jgi:branched-chain amino acid aminotransferase
MKVVLNGKLVPEAEAVVSVFDRGFLYGDGLFETMRLHGGRPFRWAQHLERLQRGAALLDLPLAFEPESLRRLADDLVRENAMPDAVLRLAVSRGLGPRGYSPKGAGPSTLVMSLHPAPVLDPAHPPRCRLLPSSFTVPAGATLAWAKHASRLVHVMARAEAERRGFDDALLLSAGGEIVEATGSNIFWIERGTVCTPPLSSGALAGVTRGVVLELCKTLQLPVQERSVPLNALLGADGGFLTQSVLGVVRVAGVDAHSIPLSPMVDSIRAAYGETIRRETRPG